MLSITEIAIKKLKEELSHGAGKSFRIIFQGVG